MSLDVNASLDPHLAAVLDLVRERVAPAQRGSLEHFIRDYFDQVDREDLAERRAADLYGAALSHWTFARRREPGQTRVRVFNPSIEEHGWESTHTVVEIVNDDRPFLVDSVTMEVNRQGLTLHLIVHPVLAVARAADGTLIDAAGAARPGTRAESFIHAEVDRLSDAAQRDALAAGVARVLDDVRDAVDDWTPMLAQVDAVLAALAQQPPPLPADELDEGQAFLRWLVDNHFTFLGYRRHDLLLGEHEDRLRIVPGSSLGLLRRREGHDLAEALTVLPPEIRAFARRPELLVVTKSTERSMVHRPGYLDYIAVKRFDAAGEVCGEHRFLGLFTSTAYSASTAAIPLLRRKVARVTARAHLTAGSHAGKALVNVLETYPRDELFQIDESDLLQTAVGIVRLGERQRFRLFVRRDPFGRFVSCLIYAPRETYTTELRRKWQAMLQQAFGGSSSEFNVHLSESVLARVMIMVRTTPGAVPAVDCQQLEALLAAAARRWEDEFKEALIAAQGEARGNALWRAFGRAFPAGYREDFAPRAAVADVAMMAALSPAAPLGLCLYQPLEASPGVLRFKLFHRGRPLTPSDSLPMLEHMGVKVLDERPHRIQVDGDEPVWLHDLGLRIATGDEDASAAALREVFEDAFGRVFRGEVESDDFNRLVVAARLPALDIVILRAYAKYLRQIGFALSQSFIEASLSAHPGMARQLVDLFKLRLDPARADAGPEALTQRLRAIDAALELVDNLSEDRVLRQFMALIMATTRSNHWRRDEQGRRRSFLSLKFDPAQVPGLPVPKPMFEIFVYSTRFEGVHLRGGRVARGGLRWSDRPEDFRTEVLGLMKAQMVKNAVIVPVGSKGGFVLKRAPAPGDREAYLKEGVACYQDYLRGLLDLTDNRVGAQIVAPPQLRCHDGPDPYLVVAADKGTASFSDHANAISAEYGFWLGDAFASGGSAGYDHKAMGITARGAWESVKRHFREIGVDVQASDFTVVGIGDMSGDVFGNAMLLSPHIRLVAAFDHRHIFLDPAPLAGPSLAERRRLFALPRSSWADYDKALISPGGGVYPRTAKAITISPEVARLLTLDATTLTPAELISAILKAPVDLLFNGGIGTYVKAESESHVAVGDRANDTLRVHGCELRCKVVGEGGNLGFTQLGRIEYALTGGRLFTDAIDNSAGVDTSDHEVNIKILLGRAVAEGELTLKQRNLLLVEMTDEVAALVLADNQGQTLSLSLGARMAAQGLDAQQRFVQFLEKAGRLNRRLEFLPSDEQFGERRAKGLGLTAPERAILLAYAKIWLFDELLASPLLADPWVANTLPRYFPQALRERFAGHMAQHPLQREIIATQLANTMVNRVGSTFAHRLVDSVGATPHEVVRAYLLTREVFDFPALWRLAADSAQAGGNDVQAALLLDLSRLIERGVSWFLRSQRLADDVTATIEHFRSAVQTLAAHLPSWLDAETHNALQAGIANLNGRGVAPDLAARVATIESLYAALDIAEVATATARALQPVAELYFALSARLGLAWLRQRIEALPAAAHWQARAKGAMQDDLSDLHRRIATRALAQANGTTDTPSLLAAWQDAQRAAVEHAGQLMAELRALPDTDAAMVAVALRELRALG